MDIVNSMKADFSFAGLNLNKVVLEENNRQEHVL